LIRNVGASPIPPVRVVVPCETAGQRYRQAMALTDKAITEFSEIYEQEFGVALSRDEAVAIIGNLLTLYRDLYEWHYEKYRRDPQTPNGEPSGLARE